MKTLNVDLGPRSYPIHVGSGLLKRADLFHACIDGRRIVVVTNATVAPLYLHVLRPTLEHRELIEVILPDGEEHKTLAVWGGIFDRLLKAHCDRRTTIVALGGGVVGDIAGFAAACYQRGVPFVQVPTTLLAQVDSSVGGKTGVNHPRGKNMIGAFHQPRAVIVDTDTLQTLPDRELRAGIAEVIKYGAIRDPDLFGWLERNLPNVLQRDPEALAYVISRSCANKAEIVALDERESSLRAVLNFGHTFGHAVEAGIGYGQWLHGEAVAAGMVVAAALSRRMDWLKKTDLERIERLIEAAGLPTRLPEELEVGRLLELMAIDKKAADGKLRLVLLKGIGTAVVTDDFSADLLKQTLTACRGRRPVHG